jgi:hypothetical protein
MIPASIPATFRGIRLWRMLCEWVWLHSPEAFAFACGKEAKPLATLKGVDSPLAKGHIRQRHLPKAKPLATLKGVDSPLAKGPIRCAFAEGKAPSYIEGGGFAFGEGPHSPEANP